MTFREALGPCVAYTFAVAVSETVQLCTWKANNPDKPWRDWFRWGIPHFGTNLIAVVGVPTLWLSGNLGAVLDWVAHLPSVVLPIQLPPEMTFDKLMPVNYPVAVILGFGTDMLGDKIGFLLKVVTGRFIKGGSSEKAAGNEKAP